MALDEPDLAAEEWVGGEDAVLGCEVLEGEVGADGLAGWCGGWGEGGGEWGWARGGVWAADDAGS